MVLKRILVSCMAYLIHAVASVVETCVDLAISAVMNCFDATADFAGWVVCAVTAERTPTSSDNTKRPSMQTAGFGHVAMLKSLGA